MAIRNVSWGSLALTAVMTAGIALALVAAAAVAGGALTYSAQFDFQERASGFAFMQDGTPLVQKTEGGRVTYQDWEGRTVSTPKEGEMRGGLRSQYMGFGLATRECSVLLPNPRFVVIPVWGGERRDASVIWYFRGNKGADRRGYFIGYDKTTNLVVGYIGRNGGCDDVPPPEECFTLCERRPGGVTLLQLTGAFHFGKNSAGMALLAVDDGLVLVSPEERTVRYLWRGAPGSLKAWGWMTFACPVSDASEREGIWVRSSDRIHFVDAAGKERKNLLIPEPLRETNFQWTELPGDRYLLCNLLSYTKQEAYWLDAQGKILRRETLTREVPLSRALPFHRCVAAALPPVVGAALLAADPRQWIGLREPGTYRENLESAMTDFRWSIAIVVVLSVVSAYLCYHRQCDFGLSHTWLAVTFVLLFGLPGYLGYRFHRAWPARLPCPQCGRRVPHDRTTCLVCRHEFPAPSLRGTEIFA